MRKYHSSSHAHVGKGDQVVQTTPHRGNTTGKSNGDHPTAMFPKAPTVVFSTGNLLVVCASRNFTGWNIAASMSFMYVADQLVRLHARKCGEIYEYYDMYIQTGISGCHQSNSQVGTGLSQGQEQQSISRDSLVQCRPYTPSLTHPCVRSVLVPT